MEKKTQTPAMAALSWATGLTAGFIIFSTLSALVNGQDDPGGVLAIKLLTGIAIFPIIFFGLWLWGIFSKKESFDHNRPSVSSNTDRQIRPVVTSARETSLPGQKATTTPTKVVTTRTNQDSIKTKPIQTFSHSNTEKPGLNITDETQENESELYEQVWNEVEKNQTDIGLWAECFASCEGDENRTKALYINKRLSVIKKEIETQSLEAKRAEQEKIEKEKDVKLSILKGKADSIEDFSKTLKEMSDFFPGILKQYGYSLIQNKNRPEMWTFRLPNGTGVKNTYNIYELRTEIIKIIEEQDRKAKTKTEKEITKKLLGQDKIMDRILGFEGRLNNIDIFKETLNKMPDFFPNILKQSGYKLVEDIHKNSKKWIIYYPKSSKVRHIYYHDELLTEIRNIVENHSSHST